jgi:hypothetical protein
VVRFLVSDANSTDPYWIFSEVPIALQRCGK